MNTLSRRDWMLTVASLPAAAPAFSASASLASSESVKASAASTEEAGAPTQWSTLFTAQDVRDRLSSTSGRAEALDFCRRLGLTKVYLEAFRDGYQADAATLETARDHFRQAGLEASGCVATTQIGKPSTGWNIVVCYTHRANQERLAEVFAYAARFFDEIIIDDFFFTDCECSECAAARGDSSWRQYRAQLMLETSRSSVLGAARRANPRVKVILKFPQWYDRFQDRGYAVAGESALYDRIWVGTELRDPSSDKWGHAQQYRGFFLYRWLRDVAGAKTGGGWFDSYGTDAIFYLDQAYVTVLAGAPEAFLFHYGELNSPTYRPQAEALAAHRAALDELSKIVIRGAPRGVPAYKPPSSDPDGEAYIFDEIGMLAVPLDPRARFPADAPVALFTTQALGDSELVPQLTRFLARGRTAIVSQELAHRLEGDPRLPPGSIELGKGQHFKTVEAGAGRIAVFSDELPGLVRVDSEDKVKQVTPELRDALASLRGVIARYVPTSMDAPPRVAVFPLGASTAVFNCTEVAVNCRLSGPGLEAGRRRVRFATSGAGLEGDGPALSLPPHGLLVVE